LSIVQAIVQGVIQGLTEFLPVSSSGHLILGSRLLGLPEPGLSFSISLHVGTGLAVLIMLRSELSWLIAAIVSPGEKYQRRRALQLMSYVVLASIPAALTGIVFSGLIEPLFSSSAVASVGLIVTGLVLRFGKGSPEPTDRRRRDGARVEYQRDMPSVTLGSACLVGLAQAVAIVPGISRSGITIAAGLMSGITRQDAARFSFLLSLPAVFGAALLDLRSLGETGLPLITVNSFVGALVSSIVGVFALGTVFRTVRQGRLSAFSYYCFAVGTVSLMWLLLS
jgi:undecaprenyl-diphosphatase